MTELLDALRASVARLRRITEALDASQLDMQAYPSEWTIADVLSHLGSGAVIFQRMVDDELAGRETPSDFNQSVWNAWDAKAAAERAADSLVADTAYVDRLQSLSDEERTRLQLHMGPVTFGFAQVVGLRLNEHALHTWDVEVALDPQATVGAEAVPLVVDNLGMVVGFLGKPSGRQYDVQIATSEPSRDLRLVLGSDSVALEPRDLGGIPDLEIPAEAFIRLVYGRLDPDHTPPIKGSVDLNELRQVFAGT